MVRDGQFWQAEAIFLAYYNSIAIGKLAQPLNGPVIHYSSWYPCKLHTKDR